MSNQIKVLVVEDDPHFGQALRVVLEQGGYSVTLAVDGAKALEAVAEESFDLAVQDIKLPDASGLDVLREIVCLQPHCGAIVMTGYGTIEDAVRAMKLGAFDFLTKPFPMETMFLKIESFLDLKRLGKTSARHHDQDCFSDIITRSPSMLASLEIARKVATTPAAVLLQGESGTGKDLVAAAIHTASTRAAGPLIQVNCAAIPDNLLEAELFGVEKGAFTGADKARPGYIEMAAGGTLFLDEISEIPFELQGKLLRVLEQKKVAKIGGTTARDVDFRVISASNQSLADMVKRGQFRNDLYFRINVVIVNLPPLRERREDIPLLLAHFLDRYCTDPAGKPELTHNVLVMLSQYAYPGNVRELKNIVERLTLLYPGTKVYPHHLPPELQAPAMIGSTFESFAVGKPLKEAVTQYEKKYIEKVVEYAGGRKSIAAKMLGLSRKVLWEKLKK